MKRILLTSAKIFALSLAVLSLSHCSYFSRQTIQQGNLIEAKNVARLHNGLSKQEVATIMGSPILENIFDKDRWDYVYTFRSGFDKPVYKRVTIHFSNNKVVDIKRVNA